jgi:hypothetical protein
MSHYGHNVFCGSSIEIQLLVPSVATEDKKTVHSFALESRGVRVEKRQKN